MRGNINFSRLFVSDLVYNNSPEIALNVNSAARKIEIDETYEQYKLFALRTYRWRDLCF
jgi:hypothetical protein